MESALIVSCEEKDTVFLTELLGAASIHNIASVKSADSAEKLLLLEDFDLVIVNSPLRGESGEGFSARIASRSASKGALQVILLAESGRFPSVSSSCEDEGVFVISKPADKTIFSSALSFAKSAQNRIKRMQNENTHLKQKIEDIRIIDRAKCLLISIMKMNEQEAHKYIEKQAMDIRSTRRIVAEGILKLYENY
jgi:response regulator NasT